MAQSDACCSSSAECTGCFYLEPLSSRGCKAARYWMFITSALRGVSVYVYTTRNYLLHGLSDKCMVAGCPFAAGIGTARINDIQQVLQAV